MTEWLKILLEHAGLRGPDRADRHARRRAVQDLEARRRRHRHDAARTSTASSCVRKFKQLDPEAEVIVITGQGNIPRSVEAVKAGAFDFLEKPIDAERLLDKLEKAIKQKTLIGRERAAQAEAAGSLQVPERHRQEQEDAGALRADRERRGERGEHPHPGRERHRQGADRQRHPLQQQAVQGAVHQDQLRGDSEGPDRVGAVRLQEGRVHRRDDGQGRPVRDGRGRLAAARRNRRDAAVPADQAAARAAGARVPADWQRPHRPRRFPADLRDQHRSRRGAARRPAARGPLLPHQHDHAARAAAARAHRRHPAAVRLLPRQVPRSAIRRTSRRWRRRCITC